MQDRAEASGIRAEEHVEGGEMLECGWVTSSSEALGVGKCLGQLSPAPCEVGAQQWCLLTAFAGSDSYF